MLFVPVLVLLGLLAYAHACPHYPEVRFGDGGTWLESVALYEARGLESVAVLSWLHLGLLTGPVCLSACLAAVPQVALLVFLYHALSSLGWMYLALFALAGARVVGVLRSGGGPRGAGLAVAVVLAATLAGLQHYKRPIYHPAYFADRGSRSFWHNALMGFGYHSKLRVAHDTAIDDIRVIL